MSFFYWIREIWRIGIPCFFHVVTGLYCPGCGGTRAVKAFLRGDLLNSFRYHPLVLYVAVVIALEAITWLLAAVFKKPELHRKRYYGIIYLGIGVILVNWLVKNIFLLAKGVDLLY